MIKKSDRMTCTSTDLLDENSASPKEVKAILLPLNEVPSSHMEDPKKKVEVNESENTLLLSRLSNRNS